ncbi:MAG: NlpC/P60 family protein [Acidaminococcus sp.]|uniref:C40 family peptidase n=1 Tax=Acidaminococcus sp. TaxID=1872103 RepID=UPI0026E0851D|nr:NlpC/P60 family protein [Acidaminococcus sp.]MDO5596756.1 NlpC/P60 family protein [Acidaminococcus sp.]
MKLHNVVLTLFLSLLALPLSAGAAAHKTVPLKVGDHGWKVKTVQIKLNAIGMKTPTTGKYTKDLETQVRAFQRSHRLPSTGKVDDTTYFRIQEAAFEKEGIHGIRGEDVVRTASRYKGVSYSFGGTTPRAFDCSGYVQYVFRQHKATLPRTADLQYEKGLFVTQRQLKPGDLVFFSTYEPGASHVGIYAGDGLFWNATSSAGVRLCSLSDEYWRTRYYGAKRVLVPAHKRYK